MVINFNKKTFNSKYIAKISMAYDYALDFLKISNKNLEINISFVSKNEIKSLNANFRNMDKVTDVLSFPTLLEPNKTNMQVIIDKLNNNVFLTDLNPETNCIVIGDVCICKQIVYQHAKEYGNTRMREMVYMAVHGLLHLLGYDHILDDDRKIMRGIEEEIMAHLDLKRGV